MKPLLVASDIRDRLSCGFIKAKNQKKNKADQIAQRDFVIGGLVINIAGIQAAG
jgi:hypothetical protein